jgi:hypothetical protein
MKIGKWARLLLAAAPLLAGCGDFWQAPGGSSSFTLSNSGNITVAQGATGTATITVTPGSSFTGTVSLSCAVTAPTGASNAATCSLSSTSLAFSSTSAQSSTLTATTSSSTTTGAYQFLVTGSSSGYTSESTTVCVEVGTGTCSSTSSSSGNFYILNSNSIAGYSMNANSLTSISGSSFTVTGASSVAMAPSGGFLYVASIGSGITLYTITSTGALTPGAVIDYDTVAQAIQVDPSGKWLLDASSTGELRAIPITSSGTLDSSRSIEAQAMAGTAVQQMAITPNGALVAVALGSTGTQLFGFTSGNASPLGAGSTAIRTWNTSAGSAISVAMDPQNRLLYIGEIAAFPSSSTNSGALRVFTISGNSVTEFTYTTPYASGGLAPHVILPNASGTYVYAANGTGPTSAGNITGFAVTTTALTTSSTVAAGAQPAGLAEDSTHSWVFEVGSSGSPYFDAYTFDASTTGQLDSQFTSTSAATSMAIVAAP